MRGGFKLIVRASRIEGSVRAPPSKSYTHRALFAALLAEGRSVVENPLIAGDTEATINAVRAMGARVERVEQGLAVEGVGSPRWPGSIYAAGSATTLRIAMALAALVEEPSLLYGDDTLNRRPVKPLAEALEALGARVLTAPGGTPPVAVSGFGSKPGSKLVEVDAWISSQFLSAMLFLAAALGDLEVRALRVSSRPYVEITLRVLRGFGVEFERASSSVFRPRGRPSPSRYVVPGDWSSASFMLVAGAIAGKVRVEGIDPGDVQPDRAVVDVLRKSGATVRLGPGYVEAENTGPLEPFEADLSDSPDLAPPLAVLAAYARGRSVLRGVGRLRYKESDRLAAIVENLSRIGVDARVTCGGNCLEVLGRGEVEGGHVSGYNDHRIIMAFAVAGLASKRPIVIDRADRFRDSYPGFLDHLKSLGARVGVERFGPGEGL